MRYLILIVTLGFFISQSNAQGLFDKIKEKVEQKVEEKTEETIDQSTEENSEENGEETEVQDQEQEEQQTESTQIEEQKEVKKGDDLKTFSKFDFVPGEKVIYFDDFSQDAVADFPANWNTNSSGEVITTNLFPGNWFKITGTGWFIPDGIPQLPDNFTAQFDIIFQCPEEEINGHSFTLTIVDGNYDNPDEGGAIPGSAGLYFWFTKHSVDFSNYSDGNYIIDGRKDIMAVYDDVTKVSISAQKQRVRLYINETKVFDIPKGLPANHIYNMFRFENNSVCNPLITNLRIAVGLPDTRNKLLTEGKLVTRGILFDTNSDKIKPESYGTLKDIAAVLKENANVKVKIVGHTDSDGSDAANLDLSKRRALSVKQSLINDFGIEESRMQTDGKGESEPTDKNDTAQGKANNRRVEFVKL